MDITSALNNPLLIQKTILDDYVTRLDDSDVAVVDANNTFAFLLEAFSQTVAQATIAEEAKIRAIYPKRASTTEELLNHVSDYEYVGFFSYPASLKIQMMFHRDFLVRNAVEVPNTNYKLVIIPADTIFTIGRYKFSLYYPIAIKINTLIDTVSVSYDTSSNNPLKSLSTNTIEVKSDNYQGIDLISFELEAYQFNKTIYTESINSKIGFIKKYSYDNKFYAIRIFDITSGTAVELNYSLSDAVYDTSKPTMILKVLPEEKAIVLNLPQIYLTNGLVGTKIQVEIYDTLGNIDVSIANIELQDISANFAMSSPNTNLTYTNILRKIPTIIIQPSNTRITGGSDNLTFEEMKDFVIYHNNALSVPITRLDLERFFEKNGFIYMMKLDNLTDRRYYGYKKLYNGDEELGVASGNLTIQYTEGISNDSILYQTNDTIVILPTVIYKYNENVKKFEVLSNEQKALIDNASGNELANMLNNNDYFGNPHHIVISTLDRYPTCSLYDLLSTETSNITFLEENSATSSQLSLISAAIYHLKNGSGGYTLRIGIQRSEDLNDIDNSLLRCYLTMVSEEGYRVGMAGTYMDTYNGIDVFDFNLMTNYKIKNDKIIFTNLIASGDTVADEYAIDLSGKMYISTFVKKSFSPTIAQNDTILNYLTVNDGTWLALSLQSLEYVLGSNLSDVLDDNLLTNWSTVEYETYTVDVPLLYDHDVYETNPDGTLKYTIVGTDIVLNKLHSIGDVVYSEGEIVYQHRIGDVVHDAGGNVIEKASRIKDFTIQLNAFEYSHVVTINSFYKTLSSSLSSYYDTIREMSENVLENTDIFFSPLVTTNTGYFRINNTTTVSTSLELSFEFNCYTQQAVIDDETILSSLEDKIQAIVISHLSDDIISMNAIASDIQTTLSAYITSIDTISLNGVNDVQTIMNINVDKSPKIGRKLVVGSDGRLTYEPLITINFKALDM